MKTPDKKELGVEVMPVGYLNLEWFPAAGRMSKKRQALNVEIHTAYQEERDAWLLLLGLSDPKIPLSASLSWARDFAALFVERLRKTEGLETLRHEVDLRPSPGDFTLLLKKAPPMDGGEYLERALLEALWDEMATAFAGRIAKFDGSVEEFFHSHSPRINVAGRVYFHLVESRDGDYPFAFLSTYVPGGKEGVKSRHIPLKHALEAFSQDGEELLELLATVHRSAKKSSVAARLVASGDLFHPLKWDAAEALEFLREVEVFDECGILCRIPDWWKSSRVPLRVAVSVGEKAPSRVGLEALLDFRPRLFFGEEEITREEANRFLAESEGLAWIKNRWVALDREKLRETLAAYDTAQQMVAEGGLTLKDALRLQLNPGQVGPDAGVAGDEASDEISVTQGQWLASVTEKLKDPGGISGVKPGRGFSAKLRGYQKKGVSWLYYLHSLGFGACLADDMGLGKTVQLLAFLNILKAREPSALSLLVIPASLISNWTAEIEKFYPGLCVFVAHPGAGSKCPEAKGAEAKGAGSKGPEAKGAASKGPGAKRAGSKGAGAKEAGVRAVGNSGEEPDLSGVDLVITTYAMAQRYAWLQSVSWTAVILDEAQAIKNPGTKQTRAVKNLHAGTRIIMTGTPVENHTGDLWSLFDFINPGILGSRTEFNRFSKGLSKKPDGYARLRTLVAPFILRRMKTDRSIISDLPEKVEMKSFAELSKRQVVLYGEMVRHLESTLAEADGIRRRGIILASLMKFKQLCNHPDHYLGSGAFAEEESGKFARLREISETILGKRERVLVFTQFKEMTGPLSDFLEKIFGRRGAALHGGTPVPKRKAMIEKFQSEAYVPYMVLSLKAGGVGLNLTKANHVVHFDRWWNPAVENQATDRAFRIGQKKGVVVHKFITRGTVEERIDAMLEEKRKLADQVVAETGEGLITEMADDALLDLFKLQL